MKRLLFGVLALLSTQLSGQALDDSPESQLLCAPFVPYAMALLEFVQNTEEIGFVHSATETMRRVSTSAIGCDEAETRLLSQRAANTELVNVQRQFEVGINSSVAVRAAQVEVEKARYCEAAFSYTMLLTENYERRRQVGLSSPGDITPILAEVEALVPVCGRVEN